MIQNYSIDQCGVIKQIEYTPKIYNQEYIDTRYNTYGELTNYMSYLRLGFVIGSIGKIPNSILDVGYGNGNFLKACSDVIPNCWGHDVSNVKISEKINITDNIFDRNYEVITFFDSLEHFENIYFLDKLDCKYICISVPWCHNFNDGWFLNWKHRRPDEHLWHFNEKSLKRFFESQNFIQINSSNIEDSIRKTDNQYPNILTAMFKKI
jgi:hypothetical protein